MSKKSSKEIIPVKEEKSPKVMFISKISGIQEKLTFLAQSLNNEADAEKEKIYIEVFPAKKSDGIENKIRFSTKTGVYSEITAVDKFDGDVIEDSIAVNLFDFYNIISLCDETISLWIDTDSNELVIDSYYDEVNDIDELEVRLPILETNVKTDCNIPEATDKPELKVHIKPVDMYSILKETNILNTTEYVNFVSKDNKLYITTTDPTGAVDIVLHLKSLSKQEFPIEFSRTIPISILRLIAGSGEMFGLDFNFFMDYLYVETNAYTFSYRYENFPKEIGKMVSRFLVVEENAKDGFIVEAETFNMHLGLLNKMNVLGAPIKVEKVDDKTMDMSIVSDGRYSISSRIKLAMLTDSAMMIDGHLFQDLFDKSGVDALKFSIIKDGIYCKIENNMIIKEVFYNHVIYTDGKKK